MSQQQPIYILPENTQRYLGKDAQRNNIMAAKLVAETVRTTLGPKGMDKMIVDSIGDITVTNDGVTILKEMQIEHPAAKMIVEVAKTQDEQVGDGTTTAVILAGELLKNAEKLLDQNIHPTVITKGYSMASEHAQTTLKKLAENISINDKETLLKIAITSMIGKHGAAKEKLAKILLEAVLEVAEGSKINMDNIKLEKKVGGGMEDSELVHGIIIDKERVNSEMPSRIEYAKIALLDGALEIKAPETETKVQISDPAQLQAFLDQEEKILKFMVQKIIDAGANVVFCQKGIDDVAQYYLAKAGIIAARRVKKSDMEKLARATGAKIVNKVSELTAIEIGTAGIVEEIKVNDEELIYIKDCKNPKAVTILVRGGTEHVVDEIERAMVDSLSCLIAAVQIGKVVGGAGAIEIELARELRKFATSLSGREQLAVLSFADAVEVVPRTLAENAGLDPIDILTELKAKHDAGIKWAGIDVLSGKIMDSWSNGVIEPLKIKTQAVKSASEVAELILRIDDVIAGSGSRQPQMPQGMPSMDM
ncbi:TCP-1/cpn60 chaperonin family protein [Candidatus Woesearchaeota archaeon]|nr:TCP-1/cpn60 chaperonin family protein [Candidatus Woesearchaeota archaeon]